MRRVPGRFPDAGELQEPGNFKPLGRLRSFVVRSERELIEPVYRDLFGDGEPRLYCRFRDDRANKYTPHEGILQVGQDWVWILWRPDTGEYRELEVET